MLHRAREVCAGSLSSGSRCLLSLHCGHKRLGTLVLPYPKLLLESPRWQVPLEGGCGANLSSFTPCAEFSCDTPTVLPQALPLITRPCQAHMLSPFSLPAGGLGSPALLGASLSIHFLSDRSASQGLSPRSVPYS